MDRSEVTFIDNHLTTITFHCLVVVGALAVVVGELACEDWFEMRALAGCWGELHLLFLLVLSVGCGHPSKQQEQQQPGVAGPDRSTGQHPHSPLQEQDTDQGDIQGTCPADGVRNCSYTRLTAQKRGVWPVYLCILFQPINRIVKLDSIVCGNHIKVCGTAWTALKTDCFIPPFNLQEVRLSSSTCARTPHPRSHAEMEQGLLHVLWYLELNQLALERV